MIDSQILDLISASRSSRDGNKDRGAGKVIKGDKAFGNPGYGFRHQNAGVGHYKLIFNIIY